MKRILFAAAAALLLAASPLHAQDQVASFEIILTPGDSIRQSGDLSGSIAAYKRTVDPGNIFKTGDQSVAKSVYFADLYNLACAYSRLGQQDSALRYLDRHIAESGDSSTEALSDPDLVKLKSHPGWARIEDLLMKFHEAMSGSKVVDPVYAKALWQMQAADQAYYPEIGIAEQRTGKSSEVSLALWDLKEKLNTEN